MVLPALFILGSALKAGSTIQQGRIADWEARAEAKLHERNARIAELDALARLRKGKFDQLRQAEEGERVMGRLRAGLGKSGARLDVGAPIRLLIDQAEELELENLLIGEEASTEAARFREQALISRFKATMTKARGKAARSAAISQAGASLLMDFATASAFGFFDKAPGAVETEQVGKVGTLKGRRVEKKGAFAGTNVSSAAPFGTMFG